MYGKPLVYKGYITSLTVNERSASVYSVMLINEFGEYSHQFTIEAGKYNTNCMKPILNCKYYNMNQKTTVGTIYI